MFLFSGESNSYCQPKPVQLRRYVWTHKDQSLHTQTSQVCAAGKAREDANVALATFLNIGSHFLNTEQDSFILNPNVRNLQLVSKPGRGKDRDFITAFCKPSK